MTFHPYGADALLINFEQKIDTAINAQVTQLKMAIEAAKFPGISFLIPAYCSLTVGYDSKILEYSTLCLLINNLKASYPQSTVVNTRIVKIPVCYDAEFGLDLAALAGDKQMKAQDIINLHTATLFRVYMLGFLPGFAYMGNLPEQFVGARNTTPRLRVPALSVGLAGHQTGIYPSEAPGGWQIIGRTPLPIFEPLKTNPFLFQAGDQVQFEAISRKEYDRLLKA